MYEIVIIDDEEFILQTLVKQVKWEEYGFNVTGYFNGKRKVKTVYGKTIKEVEDRARELLVNIDAGINLGLKKITVEEWANTWLNVFKQNIAHNTRLKYEGIIKNFIVPYMGNMCLSDVKLDLIQYSINEMSKKYASASVKKYKDTLHQIFEQAIKMRYISLNPVNGVSMPRFTQNSREALSDQEVMDITEFCNGDKRWTMIMTYLYTGMRRGEVLALTVGDVNLNKRIITINKAIEFVSGRPRVKCPKTEKGNRIVPILEQLVPYLEQAMFNKDKTEPLFEDYKGTYMGEATIRTYYKNFLIEYNSYRKKKYNTEEEVRFTIHQFRHTYCSILYKAGIDVKTSQELLGHSSVNVTLGIYTHLDKALKEYNTGRLNAYLSNMSNVSQKSVS